MNHLIAVSFALLYAPYTFSILLSYFHLISFCALIFFGYVKEKSGMIFPLNIFCFSINFILLICGLYGLGDKRKQMFS